MSDKPLWSPSDERIATANLTDFTNAASKRAGRSFASYQQVHAWSVEDRAAFWDLVWDYCGVIGIKGGNVLAGAGRMPGESFFRDASLNFAENLLRHSGPQDAIVFRGESKVERRWSRDDLHATVSRLQQLFADLGVEPGDRIAAMMPNMPETIACMLAAASLGAVWSSCSPDFGEQAVLDRFRQIEPVVVIVPDGYWYNGKPIDVASKVTAVATKLLTASKVLVVDYLGNAKMLASQIDRAEAFDLALVRYEPRTVTFRHLPFSHPLYILFSSGTTGVPKCIVHSAGGVLLQHLKEHRLHGDIREGDRVFYFTTCGWMMWNWLASALASGATLLLFDGSPFFPNGNTLLDFAQAEKMTHFGTSAKFIDTLRKSGLQPVATHDLSMLRTIFSTGSPLSPEGFAFVYSGIKQDVHLASISGGTDICGCFVLGVPTEPVWTGEIQGAGLGMAVDVWNDDGHPIRQGKGELVCSKSFPSMPLGFLNDVEGNRYRAAYFDRFDGVWCHGDFAEWTAHGGLIIHGRSDATLNPGGVRIGTAEIYNQLESMPEIQEAVCIGQEFDDDVRVILFVRLSPGVVLDADLDKRIKTSIRNGASPRHVPSKIIAIKDIPRTKSGKLSELAVRDIVHGRTVKNMDALENPDALDLFKHLPELQP